MRRLAVRLLQQSALACLLASCASSDLESRIEAAYSNIEHFDNQLSVSVIRTNNGRTFSLSTSHFKGDNIPAAKEAQAYISTTRDDVIIEMTSLTNEPEALQAFGDPAFQRWLDVIAHGLADTKTDVFDEGAPSLRLSLTIAPGKSAINDITATEIVSSGQASLSFTAPTYWIASDVNRRHFADSLAHEVHHLYAAVQPGADADSALNDIRKRSFNEAVANAFAACSMGRAFGFGSLFLEPMVPISAEGASEDAASRLGVAPDASLRFIAQAEAPALQSSVVPDGSITGPDLLVRSRAIAAMLFTTWWSSHFGPAYFVEFSGEQRAALDKACAPDRLTTSGHFRQAILDLASDGVDAQPFPARDGPEARADWEKLKAALTAWRADHGLHAHPASPAALLN